ncbi:hypothetical protein [Acidithiobacillus sp.]|uniref:hypothetical protein n=1 Tax=Acidithiobacillus sp. TaxID=1872118 RepID=UPI00356A5995
MNIDINIKKEPIIFNGKEIRIYNINDKGHYPSVTTILDIDNSYMDWSIHVKNAKEILLYAQTVGTIAHWRIQNFLADKWNVPNIDLELSKIQQQKYNEWFNKFPYDTCHFGIELTIEKIMDIFEDWYYTYKPELPLNKKNKQNLNIYPFEKIIYSHKFCYAGSIDIIASILFKKNKRLNCLLDIKTSDSEKISFKLQTVAYLYALKEIYPEIDIDEIRIIQIQKSIKHYNYFFRKWKKPIEYYWKMWLKLLGLYYLKYGNEYPLSLYKNTVLTNIKNEGIDLSNSEYVSEEELMNESENI